jgi:hypothetical protein
MSTTGLRQAADAIRKRADAASEGPWEAYDLPDPGAGRWQMVGVGIADDEMGHRAEAMFRHDAEHIASWSPETALAVADLLDEIAKHHDRWAISRGLQPVARRALAVADAYLGVAT